MALSPQNGPLPVSDPISAPRNPLSLPDLGPLEERPLSPSLHIMAAQFNLATLLPRVSICFNALPRFTTR